MACQFAGHVASVRLYGSKGQAFQSRPVSGCMLHLCIRKLELCTQVVGFQLGLRTQEPKSYSLLLLV